MRAFGGFLVFAGFASAVLHFTDYQLRILMWSEPMQPVLGVGLGVAGCALVGVSVAIQKNKEARAIQALPPPPGYGPVPQQAPYGPPPGMMPQHQMPYGPAPQPYPSQPYPPQQYPAPPQPYAPQPGSFGPQGFGPRS